MITAKNRYNQYKKKLKEEEIRKLKEEQQRKRDHPESLRCLMASIALRDSWQKEADVFLECSFFNDKYPGRMCAAYLPDDPDPKDEGMRTVTCMAEQYCDEEGPCQGRRYTGCGEECADAPIPEEFYWVTDKDSDDENDQGSSFLDSILDLF